MKNNLEAILDECLNQLDEEGSLEACVAQYPALAARLEPLLRLAFQLKDLQREHVPSPAALERAKQQLLHEAARLRSTQENRARARHVPLWLNVRSLVRRGMATTVLVALLIAMVLGGGTIAASAKSLPGDTLYPVKRMAEEVQLLLTFNQQAKVQLLQKFDQRRREEAKALAANQRVAELSFRGRIEAMDGACWTIDGLLVSISNESLIEGEIAVGTLVRAHVQSLGDGTLMAIRILAESAEAVLEPTALPTIQVIASPILMPVQLSTATASPTPSFVVSASPQVTAAPTPTPSVPPREVKVRFEGRIEAIKADAWTIDGHVVRVNANTRINESEGEAIIGAIAKVLAVRQDDEVLLAIEIIVGNAAQASDQLFEFQGLIESFGPTQWVVGGHTLVVTADTLIKGEPQKGLLAEVKALRQSDGSLFASQIAVKLPSEEVQFEGIVQAWSAEEWVVDSTIVRLDTQTLVVGMPAVGCHVEVQGLLLSDGSVLARRIVIQPLLSPTLLIRLQTPTTGPASSQIPAAPSNTQEPASSAIVPMLLDTLPLPNEEPQILLEEGHEHE